MFSSTFHDDPMHKDCFLRKELPGLIRVGIVCPALEVGQGENGWKDMGVLQQGKGDL